MSNVHLSAAALERLSSRRALAGNGRSPVCRSLFGPVDHEELGRELRNRLREMGEDDQRRWDYNFHTDTPLPGPGRLRWEEVEGGAVPAFYRETLQVGRCRIPLCRAPPDSPSPPPPAAAVAAAAGSKGPGARLSRENRAAPRRRRGVRPRRRDPTARITDFFARRKRPAEAKAATELPAGCSPPPAAVPAEQTPRKRLRLLHYGTHGRGELPPKAQEVGAGGAASQNSPATGAGAAPATEAEPERKRLPADRG